MMDALERKENMDKEMKEQLKAIHDANSQMPKGTIHDYAMQV